MIQTTILTTLTFIIGLLPDKWVLKKKLNDHASKFSFRLLSRAFSAIVTYHQTENQPTKNGICVANHTSPIDVVLLACDTSYALVRNRWFTVNACLAWLGYFGLLLVLFCLPNLYADRLNAVSVYPLKGLISYHIYRDSGNHSIQIQKVSTPALQPGFSNCLWNPFLVYLCRSNIS